LGNVGTPQTGYVGTIGLSLVPQTSVEANPSFAYLLPGFWAVNTNNVATFSAFVAGLQTAFSGMPSAGTALFRGYSSGILFTPTRSVVLGGEVSLTVNFATGAIGGSVTNVWAHDGNVTDGFSNDVALSATMHSGSNTFSGTTDAGSPRTSELSLNSSAAGTVEGGFYGPNAQELGAVWTLSDGTTAAIGTIGASSAPPLTIGAPATPSFGPNPSPAQAAMPGGPTFDNGPYGSDVIFPLLSTSLDHTAGGVAAAPNTQSATAIVKSSSGSVRSDIQLIIPALGIDTSITLSTALANGGEVFSSTEYGRFEGLSYVSFGVWAESGGAFGRAWSATAFAFGYETPAGAIPATGKADYKGTGTVSGRVFVPQDGQIIDAYLTGNAQLTADFATGKIDGLLNVEVEYGWDVPAAWHDVTVNANIVGGTNRFSGTTGVTGSSTPPYSLKSSASGAINGAFFGPAAQNLGAVWTLSDGTGSAIGVVGAQRQ
jgi:hypothetical protein